MFEKTTKTNSPAKAKPDPEPRRTDKTTQQVKPNWQTRVMNPLLLQPKLAVSQPNDAYEQEADRVADRVMRMAAPADESVTTIPANKVQRKCTDCEEEEPKAQRKADGGSQSAALNPATVTQAGQDSGQPLDSTTRSFMQQRFGHDFADVRVHADARAAQSAQSVRARAYTIGSDIVFGPAQYRPQTGDGLRLLAHELTHVLQQGAVDQDTNDASTVPFIQRDTENKQDAPAPAPVTETGSGTAKAEKPTDAFAEWWKKVIGLEGTLEDWLRQGANKYDKGKQTNMGITRGTFAQFHGAAGLPNTDEAFAAMTPAQAMGIGRSIWKQARADKINNPGVALIIADWYWGSTVYAFARVKKVLTAMGYVVDRSKVNTTYDDLDSLTIGLINSLPPADLIKAFSDERQQHFTDIIKGDKDQAVFEEGWRKRAEERRTQAEAFKDVPVKKDDRAMLYQSFMNHLNNGNLEEAVKELNFFNEADIERFVKPLGPAKIAAIHDAARTTAGVGPDSNVARITRYRFLVYSAESAIKSGDWQKAAFFLNGFSLEDIKFYFKKWKLTAAQLAELHNGAVAHPEVGPDSRLAQLTKPPDK